MRGKLGFSCRVGIIKLSQYRSCDAGSSCMPPALLTHITNRLCILADICSLLDHPDMFAFDNPPRMRCEVTFVRNSNFDARRHRGMSTRAWVYDCTTPPPRQLQDMRTTSNYRASAKNGITNSDSNCRADCWANKICRAQRTSCRQTVGLVFCMTNERKGDFCAL